MLHYSHVSLPSSGYQDGNINQTVQYPVKFNQYVYWELREYLTSIDVPINKDNIDEYINRVYSSVNPNNYNRFAFLNISTFREVHLTKIYDMLQGEGILSNAGYAFVKYARIYNLDPLYFIAQSLVETGYGSSRFSNGITIRYIANTNCPLYRGGKLVGYRMIKLNEPTTVYNLYGIGAFNSSSNFPNKATILGTTYAYNHGWTSIDSAIKGAASFLSANYVHNPYTRQDTVYSLRYANLPRFDLWHQYCSDLNYPGLISDIMRRNQNVYVYTDNFTYNKPVF